MYNLVGILIDAFLEAMGVRDTSIKHEKAVEPEDLRELWEKGELNSKIPLSYYEWCHVSHLRDALIDESKRVFYKANWMGNIKTSFVINDGEGKVEKVLLVSKF